MVVDDEVSKVVDVISGEKEDELIGVLLDIGIVEEVSKVVDVVSGEKEDKLIGVRLDIIVVDVDSKALVEIFSVI